MSSHNHTHTNTNVAHTHAYHAAVAHTPKSTATITVEVPEETLLAHRAFAIRALQQNISLDGFRKGHVPEKVLVEKVGEMAVLSEAAEITISHLYPTIIADEKLEPLGAPQVTITKLAPGNPLHFTLAVSLIPAVTLPDYNALAQKEGGVLVNIDVSDTEVNDAIERVQRRKLAYDRLQKKAAKKEVADANGLTLPTPDTVEDAPIETEEEFLKLPLPPLTDEYVKTLGGFENVEAFRADVRKHLTSEKENEATSKRRAAITDAIVGNASIDLPDVLVESELAQMFGEMESDIARAGLTVEDYFVHIKKTKEELFAEWRPAAEKRAKLQLVLNEIAAKESIVPDEARVAAEMSSLLSRFKDADPKRVKVYVETMLTNEAVMGMLLEAQ
jgi:trigger factor